MSNKGSVKILIGVPPLAHVSLAMDEVKALQGEGYDCYTVPYGRNNQSGSAAGKLLSTISKSISVVRKLYKVKPQVLYLNSRLERVGGVRDFITLLLIRCLYYRKLCVVIKSHGSEAHSLHLSGNVFRKIVLPFLTRNVQGWILLSEEEKNTLLQHFPRMEGRLFVAPNIIEPSRCIKIDGFNKTYHLPEHTVKVLFVGRIIKEKGVFDIVDAIPGIQNHNELSFVFVGDGPDAESLHAHVKEKKLEAYCHFMGYLPDKECDHFYANSDILLFPTYYSEGFAMALFKSVAVGLPVITTAVRAAKDYLQEPSNVLWVAEQDPASVAAAVNRLLADPQLAEHMRVNNKKLGEQFSPRAVAIQMADIFKQASLNS
ncbi:MAG: glycosyltransferase family 4 protein [Ferruginibacter sp.]